MNNKILDVSVCITLWTRPDIQREQFNIIKSVKPSNLFLISDGGRNEIETNCIIESREIYNDVDWECNIQKLYYDTNQGMYKMIFNMYDFVFSKVDSVIFLEDDILPSVSFFYFCKELLEKYKDDLRITAINGSNALEEYNCKYDYVFTYANSISGYAMWKRTYDLFDKNVFKEEELFNQLSTMTSITKDRVVTSTFKQFMQYKKDYYATGHIPATEFFRSFINVTENQLDIVPCLNLISNMGFNQGEHVKNINLYPKRIQKLFNMKRYELNFPIKHPKHIMRDYKFERKIFIPKRKIIFEKIEMIVRRLLFKPEDIIKIFKRKIEQ